MDMIYKIRSWAIAVLFVTSVGGMAFAIVSTDTVAAAGGSGCSDTVLTFPAWYKGLLDDTCDVQSPATFPGGLSAFIWTIVMNVIEVFLQLVGYISVAYIIVGGFKYMTSAGSPDGTVKARKTIINAVIGLVISIFSVAIVNLVAGTIK